jgi:hypothetical protein
MAHGSRSDKVLFASYICSRVKGGADIGEEKRLSYDNILLIKVGSYTCAAAHTNTVLFLVLRACVIYSKQVCHYVKQGVAQILYGARNESRGFGSLLTYKSSTYETHIGLKN